jgi:hypothetical protein
MCCVENVIRKFQREKKFEEKEFQFGKVIAIISDDFILDIFVKNVLLK